MVSSYVGIDVSKATLEIAWAGKAATKQFRNTPGGRNALLSALQAACALAEVQVVLEPTSTYHHHLVQALATAGVAYTLSNPARTAAYARMQGSRAKTDKADAKLLAAYGASQQPKASPSPDEAQERLKALRRHKEWLDEQAQAARNRLEAAQHSPWTPPTVIKSLKRTVRDMEREAKETQEAVEQLVAQEERWQQEIELLDSIPGIGPQTAVLLISEMPSVQSCTSPKQWVAFCGVNPAPRESGKRKTSQLSRAGVSQVRAGLYFPTLSSMRFNPVIQPFNQRLEAAGKLGKVRVMAAMNKLLHLCFAILKRGTPFVLSLPSSS